jgi:hypothetical protein
VGLAITAYNLHKIGRELLRQRRAKAKRGKAARSIRIPRIIHISTFFMEEIRLDLADMVGKCNVLGHSVTLLT